MKSNRNASAPDPLRAEIAHIVRSELKAELKKIFPGSRLADPLVSQLPGELPPGCNSGSTYRRIWNVLRRDGDPTLLVRGKCKLMPLSTWTAYLTRENERREVLAKTTSGSTSEDALIAQLGAKRVG